MENSYELLLNWSNISRAGNIDIGWDFQNLQKYQFEPDNQNQTFSFRYDHSPKKAGEKNESQSLHNSVGSK